MTDSASQQQLHSLLEAESTLGEQLLSLLQRETTVLEQRDTEALVALTEEKQQLLQVLEEKAAQRSRFLQADGLSQDKAGFEQLLERLGNPPTSLHLWEKLHGLLEQCQRQNQLNGRLLEAGRRHSQQALSLLLGGQDPNAGLYDQKGSVNISTSEGHRLAKV